MKKRLLNLFLVMLMVACVLPMAANAASCVHSKGAGSTIEKVDKKEATCAADGYEEHYICTNCNKTFVTNGSGYKQGNKTVIPATGKHNYELDTTVNGGYREGDEATCVKTGIFVLKCSNSGCTATTAQTAPVNKDRHTYEDDVCTGCGDCKNKHVDNRIITAAKAATCGEPGVRYTVYQCNDCDVFFCNNEFKAQNNFPENVIPATGKHDYDEENKAYKEGFEATCQKTGLFVLTCKTCNHKTTQTAPVVACSGGNWIAKIPATCTEPGRNAGRDCKYCGKAVYQREVIPATGHTTGSAMKSYLAPTCQAVGVATYECTVCKADVGKEVAKLNCNIVPATDVAPTCNNTGLQGGTKCAVCSNGAKCTYCAKTLVAQTVVPALGHNQVVNTVIKEATCLEDGEIVYDCTRCGFDGHHVIVPKLGHDRLETVMRAVTCTEPGRLYVECKRENCGFYWVEPITPKGHTEVKMDAVEATCTATGLTEGKKCSVCDEVLLAQAVVAKKLHVWQDVEAKDPTCKEDGYNAHQKCANCNETDGKNVIAAGAAYHVYEENKCKHCGTYDPAHRHVGTITGTTAATCTAEGSKTYDCNGCDYVWTETLEKKPHNYVNDVCSKCEALDPSHEHTYTQIGYRAPTCTVEGKVTQKCSICNHQEETLIDSIGHSYTDGKCANCGIAAHCEHTHTTTTVTKAATCNRTGEKVTTCNSCGKQVGTETIPATNSHNYVNNYCTGCGKNDPDKVTVDNQDVYLLG